MLDAKLVEVTVEVELKWSEEEDEVSEDGEVVALDVGDADECVSFDEEGDAEKY